MLHSNIIALALTGCASLACSASLSSLALQKVLSDAAPIFGNYQDVKTNTSQWMKAYPDSTKIVHMNLPGTHDADTWNYTQATQDALEHVTNLTGIPEVPPKYFRCQDLSMVKMLDMGIRVFDLRPAFDVTNSTLVFWHSQALQSEISTMDDLFFGFAQWLDDHPSEAIFLSFQWEGSTMLYASYNADAQMALYNSVTSPIAKQYILQTTGELGTLGEARGKITLLRRFDLPNLPASYENSLPGLHFSPNNWTDNDPDITLIYNTTTNATAYIEDYYNIETAVGSNATENIQWKYNATTAHLTKAATQYPDSLFWSFASSENDYNIPPETPRIMALGNGTAYTPLGGVNQRLVPFLQAQKGKRLGIVMFDFFEQPADLVGTLLSLQPPPATG